MRKDYKTLRERKIQEIEDKLRKLKEINKGHRAPQTPEPQGIKNF